MKTAQSIFILLFALWLPGCGLFSGTDDGQDKGVQDLGQTDLYPCGVTDDAYGIMRVVFEPGDAVVELLPDYESDPVKVGIENIMVGWPTGGKSWSNVALKDAPYLAGITEEYVTERIPDLFPEDFTGPFVVKRVFLWTSPQIANEIARKSGTDCNPVFPFLKEF